MKEEPQARNGWEQELLHRTGLGIDNLLRIAREEKLDEWNDAARTFEFERVLHDSPMDRDSAILMAAVCLNRLGQASPPPQHLRFDTTEQTDTLTVISHYLDHMVDQYLDEPEFMAQDFPRRMEIVIADLAESNMDYTVAVFAFALSFLRLLETMPPREQPS